MNNTIRKRNQQTARRKVKKLLTTINDNQCTSSSSDEDLPAVNHADPGAKHTCTDSDIDHGQDPSASDLDVNASYDHAHAEDFDWDIVDRLEHLIEDDDSEEEDHSYMLRDRLANWAAECSIPLSSVTKLLHVLRDEDLDVPADARTLLKTPRSGTTQVSEKSDSYVTADCQLSDYKSCDTSFEPVEHAFQETDPTKQDLPLSRARKRPQHFDSEADVESCGEGTTDDTWPTGGPKERANIGQKSSRKVRTALIQVPMPKPPNYAAVVKNVKGLPSKTKTSQSTKDQLQEDDRQLQEDDQQFQEDNRQLQEDDRQLRLQEDDGQLQDDDRPLQEDDRQFQEDDPQLQDKDRQLQEDHWQLQEDDRRLQEDNRQLREDDRQLQEDDRQFQEDRQGQLPDDHFGQIDLNHQSRFDKKRQSQFLHACQSQRSSFLVTQCRPSLLTQRSTSLLTPRSSALVTHRLPSPVTQRSTSLLTLRSSSLVTHRSPSPVTQRSTSLLTPRSSSLVTHRSTSPVTQRSTSLLTQRSSSLVTQRSPSMLTQRSSSLGTQRSPSPLTQRSPSPVARSSPSLLTQRSSSLVTQATPSLAMDEGEREERINASWRGVPVGERNGNAPRERMVERRGYQEREGCYNCGDGQRCNDSGDGRKWYDLIVGMSKKINEMESNQRCIMQDLGKLKAALVKRVPEDDALELFHQDKYSDVESFERFCTKLQEDQVFKDLFVSHCIQQCGSKDIGETVRQIMKLTMTDQLMVKYTRTGRDKYELPQSLQRCIRKCCRRFHEKSDIEVRRGKDLTKTTLTAEVNRQIEIYLSNSQSRAKRAIMRRSGTLNRSI